MKCTFGMRSLACATANASRNSEAKRGSFSSTPDVFAFSVATQAIARAPR